MAARWASDHLEDLRFFDPQIPGLHHPGSSAGQLAASPGHRRPHRTRLAPASARERKPAERLGGGGQLLRHHLAGGHPDTLSNQKRPHARVRGHSCPAPPDGGAPLARMARANSPECPPACHASPALRHQPDQVEAGGGQLTGATSETASDDAFSRYLPPEPPQAPPATAQSTYGQIQSATEKAKIGEDAADYSNGIKAVADVADAKSPSAGEVAEP